MSVIADAVAQRCLFLTLLHPFAFCELRAIRDDERHRAFIPAANTARMDTFLEKYHERNIYFGVATRKDSTSGGLANCVSLGALFVDIDFKDTSEADARARLATFSLPPSAIVASGGGLHVYWFLTTPLVLPDAEAVAKAWLRALAATLTGDAASAEPARVLRVPGTLNYKPEYETPRAVVLEELHESRRYTMDQFAGVLNVLVYEDSTEPAPGIDGKVHHPGRHDWLWRLARSHKAKGISFGASLKMLHVANQEQCEPPHSDAEVTRANKEAYRQHDRDSFRDKHATRELSLQAASTIDMQRADYLWEKRIPRGMLTLLVGREGEGKSLVTATVAANLSQGRLAGDYLDTPRGAIIVSGEDDWRYVITPRLAAAKADMERIFRININTTAYADIDISLPEDLPALRPLVAQHDIGLILLDPLISRLGRTLDTHVDAQVRQALEPLRNFAEDTGVTMMGIIHPNKSAGGIPMDPLNAIMGSRAFSAVTRSTLFLQADPDVESRLLYLMHVKTNIGEFAPTWELTIHSTVVGRDARGREITAPYIEWIGERDANERYQTLLHELRAREKAAQRESPRDEAGDYLKRCLADGEPMLASDIIKAASEATGLSKKSIQRAADDAGVAKTFSDDSPPRVLWSLPKTQGGIPF